MQPAERWRRANEISSKRPGFTGACKKGRYPPSQKHVLLRAITQDGAVAADRKLTHF